jgi:hypothetical protein
MTRPPVRNVPAEYQIRVDGHLDDHWSAWFGDLTLTHESDGTTSLRGAVSDQAELHGLLRKVRDLGVTLISVAVVDQCLQGSAGRVARLGNRGCDLRWRPCPGGSGDGGQEYHLDEAPEEVVGPRLPDGRAEDGDDVEEADDDVHDPADPWLEDERQDHHQGRDQDLDQGEGQE